MSELEAYRIFTEVLEERISQEEKWGNHNHKPMVWSVILGEEIGEVAKAALGIHFDDESPQQYRKELIQCAAVCVAAIENLDRKKGTDDTGPR